MKKLLIVVDYQNDFVDGALGFKGAELLEPKIAEKVKEYQKNGDDVIYTLDTHDDNYMNSMEGQKLPIPHCIKNTTGHKLFGSLEILLKDAKCFEKDTFGCSKLGDFLLDNKYDYIELVGLVSNICVFSNAVVCKTYLPNAQIVVLKDLTSSNDLSMQEKSFDVLRNLHIDVL